MMLCTLWIPTYCAYLSKVVILCILRLYIRCLLNNPLVYLVFTDGSFILGATDTKTRMYNYWQSPFQVCEPLETSMSHRGLLWALTLGWCMSISLFLLLKEYDRRKVTGWDWKWYRNEWYPFKILSIWKV